MSNGYSQIMFNEDCSRGLTEAQSTPPVLSFISDYGSYKFRNVFDFSLRKLEENIIQVKELYDIKPTQFLYQQQLEGLGMSFANYTGLCGKYFNKELILDIGKCLAEDLIDIIVLEENVAVIKTEYGIGVLGGLENAPKDIVLMNELD